MEEVIKVENLEKNYKSLPAVNDISFSVKRGEIFGILGPNGAGKTTTLEIIECLKPQTSGSVTVLGFDNLKNADEIKKRIGIQLQSSQYLHHLSLGELLDLFASLYPPTLSSRPTSAAEKRRDPLLPRVEGFLGSDATARNDKFELLRLVGLEDKKNSEVKNLSGGQKQRFTIATSLVNNPEILFLDEPTTGLDPSARRSLWQLIKDINSQGTTIVMTTHFMEEAELLCNRVAVMDEGKILEIGEPKKLIEKHTQTIQVSFFTDKNVGAEAYKKIDGVFSVRATYPQALLELTDLNKLSALVESLKKENINFYGFAVKTASLEDVYLKLTGKEYLE